MRASSKYSLVTLDEFLLRIYQETEVYMVLGAGEKRQNIVKIALWITLGFRCYLIVCVSRDFRCNERCFISPACRAIMTRNLGDRRGFRGFYRFLLLPYCRGPSHE